MRWVLPFVAGAVLTGTLHFAAAGELYDAAMAGNVDDVRRLLASGADLQDKGDLGTPLHVAVSQGDVAMVKLFLEKGASLDERSGSGSYPLHVAVGYKHEPLVALLLQHGAKVDVRDAEDRTPLHLAASGGLTAIGKVLLSNGADVNAGTGVTKYTPLHWAAFYERVEFVRLLLAFKPNVNAASDGETPLHVAAEKRSPEVVELLVAAGADLNARTKGAMTPLALAKGNSNKEVATALLRLGAKD
jgi:ankyrin repeat protein